MKLNTRKALIYFLLVIVFVMFLFFTFPEFEPVNTDTSKVDVKQSETLLPQESISEQNITGQKILLVIAGSKIETPVKNGENLYEALLVAQSMGGVKFTSKFYPGLGMFVESINELKPNGGKFLFYFVNGKEATVGVSTYIPKDGDIIEWKLK